MTVALRAESLSRTFSSPAGDVHACESIDLELRTGELLVVRGASGAGSTFSVCWIVRHPAESGSARPRRPA